MAREYCPQCGLGGQADASACPRCGFVFEQATRAPNFDESTGAPLGDPPAALRCWHCGNPIAQQATRCDNCEADLTDRLSAAAAYDVVARAGAAPPVPIPPRIVSPAAKASDSAAASSDPSDDDDGDWTPSPKPIAPPRHRSYIARHWHGELPLGVSFWVNGVLSNVVIVAVTLLVFSVIPRSDKSLLIGIALLAFMIVTITVSIWQIGGIWRSANASLARKKIEGGSLFWPLVARIVVVFSAMGVLRTVAFDYTGPEMIEVFKVTLLGDPDIPDYRLEVGPEGTSVLIEGGVKIGLPSDLRAILDANPGITRVYLNSPGGRLGPARATSELIRERGLSTYVAFDCASACTMIFTGGRERLVGPLARLGFHPPSFRGEKDQDAIDLRETYTQNGISLFFTSQVMSVEPDDIWLPNPTVLASALVITAPPDERVRPDDLVTATFLKDFALRVAELGADYQVDPGLRLSALDAEGNTLTYQFVVDPAAEPALLSLEPGFYCATIGQMVGDDGTAVMIFRDEAGGLLRTITVDRALCA